MTDTYKQLLSAQSFAIVCMVISETQRSLAQLPAPHSDEWSNQQIITPCLSSVFNALELMAMALNDEFFVSKHRDLMTDLLLGILGKVLNKTPAITFLVEARREDPNLFIELQRFTALNSMEWPR